MHYAVRNIRTLIKREPFIFAVMMLCVVSSSLIMLFSYGLYQNYHVQRYETEVEQKEIFPKMNEGAVLTQQDVVRYLGALSADTLDHIDIIYTTAQFAEYPTPYYTAVPFRFQIRDGLYKTSQITKESWENDGLILSGRYLSDDEEASGANVALVANNGSGWNEATLAIQSDINEIMLFGKPYQVVGEYHAGGGTPIVPFLSIPSDTQLGQLAFMFSSNVTSRQYSDLVEQAEVQIPGVLVFEKLDFPDSETFYIYNNIMLIAILIAVLTVVNFAILYHFIVQKRMRQIAVFQISGCSASRAFRICLSECCLLCVPTYLLGIVAYIPIMNHIFSDLFPYMQASYTPYVYLAIFAIYLVILLVVISGMLLRVLNQKPIDTWKGGNSSCC